jgi:PAS domain S-box-containing protein
VSGLEHQFRNILIGTALIDPKSGGGRILSVSEGFERVTGYPAHEVIGTSLDLLMRPDANPENCLRLAQAVAGSRVDRGTFNCYPKSGEMFLAAIVVSPMRDQAGRLLSCVTIIQEAEPNEPNHPLTEIAAASPDAERPLCNRGGVAAVDHEARIRELQAANRDLEILVSSLCHDMQAPVRHIDGFMRLLRQKMEGGLDTTSERYVDIVSDAARRLGRMLTDLLAFVRAGKVELRKVRVPLEAVVRGAQQDLSLAVDAKPIDWDIGTLPELTIDAAMLRRAFHNLMENAVKYTRKADRPRIEVGVSESLPDSVVIFVKDNGVGFDMRAAGKLFDLFQRFHQNSDFEGSGIGLASVARIVARHGGRVWAVAEQGKGATFFLQLPRS